MKLIKLEPKIKRRLRKIYNSLDDGSNLCDSGCFECCVKEIKLSYIEFAYLVDGLSEDQITSTFKKPERTREDGRYLCKLLDDSNMCAQYDNRPWICRVHKKYQEHNICMNKPTESKNLDSARKILKLNNKLRIPKRFKDYTREEMTITDFYNELVKRKITI
jgi:Fe-S-cluster containining protein